MEVKNKIVLWCGNASNHKALANKLHKQFGLSGIVIDNKVNKKANSKSENIFRKAYRYIIFMKINNAWQQLLRYYNVNYPGWPDVPVLKVDKINTDKTKSFTEKICPDLIVVSGTGLIREELLNVPVQIGIMNLHTGLSPYVKGGPNCTNWCIANNEWGLVGNTIMWINAGIDTGNIITSETIEIRKCSTLYQVQLKVMEHAHDLYIRAISYILNCKPPYISIPQKQLGEGQLFLTKMWTDNARKQMLINWKKRKKVTDIIFPQTIKLPE